jgi:hypothetical protein
LSVDAHFREDFADETAPVLDREVRPIVDERTQHVLLTEEEGRGFDVVKVFRSASSSPERFGNPTQKLGLLAFTPARFDRMSARMEFARSSWSACAGDYPALARGLTVADDPAGVGRRDLNGAQPSSVV